MGGAWCNEGRGFEYWMEFFRIYLFYKFVMIVLGETKIIEKEAGMGHLKNITRENARILLLSSWKTKVSFYGIELKSR